jgi:hypothetical protein
MATQFKQVHKSGVMCTVQGCGEVAALFYARHCDPFRREPVLAAYCKEHAEAAAERFRTLAVSTGLGERDLAMQHRGKHGTFQGLGRVGHYSALRGSAVSGEANGHT